MVDYKVKVLYLFPIVTFSIILLLQLGKHTSYWIYMYVVAKLLYLLKSILFLEKS